MSQHPSSNAVRAAERGPQSAVCSGISALVRERWGRGPSRSRAYWAGPDAMVVLLDDAHTESERTLTERGHGAEVLAGRRLLGQLAEDDLRRIAESATGREVRAVLTQTTLAPALSVVVYAFVPDRRSGVDEDRFGDAMRRALEHTSDARALMAESEQVRRRNAERRTDSTAAREGRASRRRPERPDDAES